MSKLLILLDNKTTTAAAEHGLKILAMLYLTPIAPLGPLSYMSGTTSMALSHFALAKIASLPIMMLYVFIGASAGALVAASSRDSGNLEENAHKLEENPVLILFGIVISVVMISTISVYIKKELFKVSTARKNSNGDHEEIMFLVLFIFVTHHPTTKYDFNNDNKKILERQKRLAGSHVDLSAFDQGFSDEEFEDEDAVVDLENFQPGATGPRHRVISTDRGDFIDKGGSSGGGAAGVGSATKQQI